MTRLAPLGLLLCLAGCTEVALAPAPGRIAPGARREFILVGDTQKTMTLECWRPHHDLERQAVIRAIAEERPAFIVNAGDVVCHGGRRADWERFCAENRPIFDRNIAYFPAVGNHDLYGGRDAALRLRAEVFPQVGFRRWYAIRFAPVQIAILDSNFDELDPADIREQDRWLGALLAESERDPEIRHVLLVCHHPPYTNARGLSGSREVEDHFVSRITPKVRVVCCGHVHSYERFEKKGVIYLVSGGGGGPTRELNHDHPLHEDLYLGDRARPFHYCRFSLDGEQLRCDVLMLGKEGSFSRVDGFARP